MEEYLSHVWRPDCEFVDGKSVERNGFDYNHSRLVTILICKSAEVLMLPSLRMRVASTRVRVPDVCIIRRGGPPEQVVTHPPLAVIEILSEEDRFSATMEKLEDYQRFGIENIWIVDPELRLAYRYTAAGLEGVRDGELTVPGTPIRVVLSEMFAELDRV